MTAHKSYSIIDISLDGFQVFSQPTRIPLGRLTLLFGPNSAGKSAVQDAIELYGALMDHKTHRNDIDELLARHWRRTGSSNDSRVNKLSIGVTHSTHNLTFHAVIGDELDRKIWGDLDEDIERWRCESRWSFERSESEGQDLAYESCFEFFIESVLLMRHSLVGIVVNLAHPLLSQTELKVDFAAFANTYPDEVRLQDGLLTIRGDFLGFHPSGSNEFSHDAHSWMSYYSDQGYSHPSNDKSTLFYAAIVEVNLLIGCILRIANRNSSFHPTKVDASRTVPTRQEMTYQIGNLDDSMLQWPLSDTGIYRTLAESLSGELTDVWEERPLAASKRKYADAVNQALAHHLFLDQGYRLDYDFRLLMSEANSKAGLIDGESLDAAEFGFLVEIVLRDGQGRKHLFQDVGSGIGYLLPVLCAVYEQRSKHESTCFIQQPELHIHPALQAAMGDVFIEGSDEDHQILIETHSEHMLLRILKRIRQTHLHANLAPELKINADDVCVLYFDPSPGGTTTVKRLRITEDGEFMDRWPRGFFGERDQELLDE